MKPLACVLAVLSLLLTAPQARAQYSQPEFRAMWVTRFEWPSTDPVVCRARIDSIMQDLADHGFNAVFFQVRGQADVFYPSPYEPWSPLIGGADPGWDPLAYAIDAAHAVGIEFHAYINTHTCWLGSQPPANPDHLYYAHCNAADPAHRDWLVHGAGGTPAQLSEGYVWIAPGVPAYQAYIRRQIMYVVENYDIDGVHFDRIRTSGPGYSYDPISEGRRVNPQANPDGLAFHPWTADQITRNVRDIYAAIMDVKPQLRVSAAVMYYPASSPTGEHQDTLAWLATGGLDTAVPMAYFSGGVGTAWDTQLQQWVSGSSGRHIVEGHSTSEGVAMLLEQIALTRTRGSHGNSVFSWGSFTFWDDYLDNVYQVPSAIPAMGWKGATGVISGLVTTTGGTPVVDAHLTRSGSDYTGLSTGDGFYSLLLVPAGSYTLSASHPNHGSATQSSVSVAAGAVTHVNLTLPLNLPPIIAAVAPNPDSAVAESLYNRQLALTQGLADSYTLLEAPVGATVGLGGQVAWRPVLADGGTTVTFTVRATNTIGSDEETWQVAVSPAPPCTVVRLSDFEGYSVGSRVLFQNPRYSSSTQLAASPDIARVTTATAFTGSKSYELQWQWLDTAPQRRLRLTTHDAPNVPNPTVSLRRPIRINLRLDSGNLRLCLGLRETNTTADLGANGGTSGAIEWLGATSVINGVPQGVLVQANPGVWQTFTFNPLTDPVQPMTGDGVLASDTGKVTLEELAFALVDTAGPITLYLDDIDILCRARPYGDFNADTWVNLTDLDLLLGCRSGQGGSPSIPPCGGVDSDGDLDVDQEDFGRFQRCLDTAGPQMNLQCVE